MRRGFFRLWVVTTVLWIGLVGWSHWDDLKASVADGCWKTEHAWRPACESDASGETWCDFPQSTSNPGGVIT